MPLIKGAKTPVPAAVATQPVQPETPNTTTKVSNNGSFDLVSALAKLDPKDRKILLQGSYQAALHSVGVVQHGGGTPESYLARVEEAANACASYVLRSL